MTNMTQTFETARERRVNYINDTARARKFKAIAKAKSAKSKNFMYERRLLPVNFFDVKEEYSSWVEEGMKKAQADGDTKAVEVYEVMLDNARNKGFSIDGFTMIRCIKEVAHWNTFAQSCLDQFYEWGSISTGQEEALIKMFQKMAKKNVDEKGQMISGLKPEDKTPNYNIFYSIKRVDHSEANNAKAKAIFDKNDHINVKAVTKVFGEGWQSTKEAS